MTPQQIFDAGLKHIRQQGKPALRLGGKCAYRTPQGLKCIVGGLIPDEVYQPSWDEDGGLSANQLPEFVLQRLGIDEVSLLSDMQFAHDDASRHLTHFLVLFEDHMRDIAHRYNLTYSPARPRECPASGAGHNDGPHGINGETQCAYCGLAP